MEDKLERTEFLEKAWKYVQKKADEIKEHPFRQKYHFEVPSGWCNDPNGFSYQRGEYHLFYQHMPYDAEPADYVMYWGHAKSKDLIHWKDLPIAIGPESEEDRMGCWSGCSFEQDGKMILYYTGLDRDKWQKQNMAISEDGIIFKKYENNPVLGKTLCEAEAKDFRDPFIWKHKDRMYMIVGSTRKGFGCIPLYESEDGLNWKFKNFLVESLGELGTVCECPNFIEIDGKYVLFISPHGMNYRKSLYLVGDFDYVTGKFFWHNYGEIDWGMDYYAPQAITDAKGRKISIGWMNSWEWMPWSDGTYYTTELGWCGGMSLPREMWLNRENQLCSRPVEEVINLREKEYRWEHICLEDGERFSVETEDNRHLELLFCTDGKNCTASKIQIVLGDETENNVKVTLDMNKGEMIFDRTEDLQKKNDIRKCDLRAVMESMVEIHMYLDSSSIEIFTDNYATAMTNTFYLPKEANKLCIYSIGGEVVLKNLGAWTLKSIK